MGLLLVLLAAGLRLWSLGQPSTLVWDEHYYVFDGSNLLGGATGQPEAHPRYIINGEGTWQHPPLGKILIGLGEGPLPESPWGWRLPSVLFGTAAVGLTYLLGLELLGSVSLAGLAGLAVALDGLEIVQSRVAMLDMFLATFALAGIYLVVRERTHPTPDRPPGRVSSLAGGRRRLWAGAAFGAAVACKWDGVFLLALGAGLTLVWDRQSGRSSRADLSRWAFAFLAVPVAVYVASYAWFWAEHGPQIPGWFTLQFDMLKHQLKYKTTQPQTSRPWLWPILVHPIRYWSTAGAGRPGQAGAEIVSVGNPALWWGYLLAAPVLLWAARRRGWVTRLILGGFLISWLPWMAVWRPQYCFYLLPAVPFMALGVTAAIRTLPGKWRAAAAVGFGCAVAFWAVALMPVWLGLHGGPGWARHFALLSSWT
ncbi:MAG TPA: phospholipid carrier-dependent glycosyltransferase [Acidimicrobiales bacterium]|nr:phospholipid carrier-dependent glycosyltransferase [Acidimicrobiales bacterium]